MPLAPSLFLFFGILAAIVLILVSIFKLRIFFKHFINCVFDVKIAVLGNMYLGQRKHIIHAIFSHIVLQTSPFYFQVCGLFLGFPCLFISFGFTVVSVSSSGLVPTGFFFGFSLLFALPLPSFSGDALLDSIINFFL